MMNWLNFLDALQNQQPETAKSIFLNPMMTGGYGGQMSQGAGTEGQFPFSSMTGYGGQMPQGALKGAQYEQLFRNMNSQSNLQRQGQQFGNAASDKAYARQVGWNAYKDQDQGPIPVTGLFDMVKKMNSQQQPFRTNPMLSWDNYNMTSRG